MISADDARSTYELDDRYVIEPEFVEYTRKSFSKVRGVKKVPESFSYGSDNNEERLDAQGILGMMKTYLE